MADPNERTFTLDVEVPPDVKSDPVKLRKFLRDMAKDLAHNEDVEVTEDPAGGGGANTVRVTMRVRPCGPRA
jgi:hypothetical protein